ncbi:GGDEF domain-containing protein [Vibrio diazotrophicus]|uniref:diguanylate cyclase n=1 Tax=Vibrio diazotrophicus TaxID=685 RepID=A0ABX4WFL6_VIBDI|nr:GGDEF domain-containing protein [Vibrio diazotrophicus]PNI02140.1 GGDEF domain-containing protein [Vibrio diazotrophicus]
MDVHIFDNSHTLRASVLTGVSLFMSVIALCFTVFHFHVTGKYFHSGLDLILGGYSFYAYQLAKKNKHKKHHIQIFVYLFTFVASTSIYTQPIEHGTYVWTMLFPIFFYSLLGIKQGRAFCFAVLLIHLTSIYHKVDSNQVLQAIPTFTNLIACYVCIWIIAHIYEFNRRNIENSLTYLASRDSLTGAHNRLSLTSTFKHFETHKDDETTLCLLFIDLDYFKKVNDQYGHDAGDKVLMETTRLLCQVVGDDNLYRIGGEEFCVTLFDHPIELAEQVGERVRSMMSQHLFAFGDKRIHITLSVGICEYSDGDKLSDLLKLADLQLYKAKENGRNQVRLSRASKDLTEDTSTC